MLQNIFNYLTLIFITGLFSLIYFYLLKKSMDKVLTKQKSINHIYSSFLLRIFLAGLFFYLILKYYKKIEEFILIILTFAFFRYFATRKDKLNVKNTKKDIL